MPFTEVMKKFKKGLLHSGSDDGPKVKNKKQALAIMFSEKRKADEGDEEYKPKKKEMKKKSKGVSTGPSEKLRKKYNFD